MVKINFRDCPLITAVTLKAGRQKCVRPIKSHDAGWAAISRRCKATCIKGILFKFQLHLLRVFIWLKRAVSGLVNLHLSVALFRNCLVFGCASNCCLTSEPHRVSIKSMTWFSSLCSGVYQKHIWLP